jgi:ketosteroid isomerase-like protein
MSREKNVEAFRRYTEAVQRGDYEAAEAELDLDGIEIDDRDIVESTGADSHRVWLDRWNDAWDTWRTEEQSVTPVGDDIVLSLFRIFVTGKGSGIELSRDDAVIARFRDGKIVKLGYYNDQSQARRDAGM